MLRNGLPAHPEAVDQLRQRLALPFEQTVQQGASCGVGQGLEDRIHN